MSIDTSASRLVALASPCGHAFFDGTAGEEPNRERERRRLEAEQKALDTCARLLAAPPSELPFRRVVADLLEFHRREAKPEWWAMFNRQDLSEDELIDDAIASGDCVTILRRRRKG